jgi:hypothetical protein
MPTSDAVYAAHPPVLTLLSLKIERGKSGFDSQRPRTEGRGGYGIDPYPCRGGVWRGTGMGPLEVDPRVTRAHPARDGSRTAAKLGVSTAQTPLSGTSRLAKPAEQVWGENGWPVQIF